MKGVSKTIIHLVNQYSNCNAQGIQQALNTYIYPNVIAWKKFLQWALLSIGLGLVVAGIIFFFAYNWEYIPRLAKLGIIESLWIGITLCALFLKIPTLAKQIVLTAASVLAGGLFALFGQIYQTGASPYHLFFAWALSILLWVLVLQFETLWLLFILLLDITIILYVLQINRAETHLLCLGILSLMHLCIWLICLVLSFYKKQIQQWFIKIIVTLLTLPVLIGMGYIIVNMRVHYDTYYSGWFLLLSILYFCLLGWFGMRQKNIFYMYVLLISIVFILPMLCVNIKDEIGAVFIASMLLIGGMIFSVKYLQNIQKKWNDEK